MFKNSAILRKNPFLSQVCNKNYYFLKTLKTACNTSSKFLFLKINSHLFDSHYKYFPVRYFRSTIKLFNRKRKQKNQPVVLNIPSSTRISVDIRNNMTIGEMAKSFSKPPDEIIKVLHRLEYSGETYVNTKISNLKLIETTAKYLHFAPRLTFQEEDDSYLDAFSRGPSDPSLLVPRPPVVTVMGHVDHGKTTLLDTMRQTSVVASEFGGITQHIGAFEISLPGGSVTFIDTPGHAAFTAMRMRGAMVTDIIILVVSAEDGVMPQTVECVEVAKSYNVPIIVAINKMDKPGSDENLTKDGLMELGIAVEDLGGDVQSVPISALKGTNIDLLQEAIIAQAELLELKADPTGLVEATVIESSLISQNIGKRATVIVQQGTLRKGAFLVAGTAYAKVRTMTSNKGEILSEAGPSVPVQVDGWKVLPSAGDQVLQVKDETRMRQVVKYRESVRLRKKSETDWDAVKGAREEQRARHKEFMSKTHARGHRGVRDGRPIPEVAKAGLKYSLVLKADVDGSLDVLLDILGTYNSTQCELDIVHIGVGDVISTDIEMAKAFNSVIYAFNVNCPPSLAEQIKSDNISIYYHNVIYHMFDHIKEQINAILPLVPVEEVVGSADVLQIFKASKNKKKVDVYGCRCLSGYLAKKGTFQIFRQNNKIFTGSIVSMRHFKDDVDVINSGNECGLDFGEGVSFQPGDFVQYTEIKHVPQTLDWNLSY